MVLKTSKIMIFNQSTYNIEFIAWISDYTNFGYVM